MARRKRADSEDSDSDWSPKKKTRSTKPQTPTTKASISILATDISIDQTSVRNRVNNIDVEALGRIKKALALASHEGTGEKEAKAALRNASKLMARYSVTQADILSQQSEAEKLQHAGTSVVSVRSTKENGFVKFEAWTQKLAHAITKFFDCQYYTTNFGGEKVDFSFYGLAEQTVAAAYAMEMAYNLILTWSLQKAKGIHGKNAYRRGVACGLAAVAKEEKKEEKEKAIVHERKLLEQKRKEEEEEERRRLDRLKDPMMIEANAVQPKIEAQDDDVGLHHKSSGHEGKVKDEVVEPAVGSIKVKLEEIADEDQPRFGSPSPSHNPDRLDFPDNSESDIDDSDDFTFGDGLATPDFDDDDDDENIIDLDAPVPRVKEEVASMPPPPLPAKQNDLKDEEPQWGSLNQLVAFRETSVAVGEEYLKSQGIKLGKGRATARLEIKDPHAHIMYKQGVQDARKIDIRGRRLKGAEQD